MKMTISLLGLLAFAISVAGCGGGNGDTETGTKSGAAPAATAPADSSSAAPPADATIPPPEAPAMAPLPDAGNARSAPAEEAAKPEPTGTPGTADALMESYIESLGEITAAFKTVSDDESAKAAGQTIRDVVSGMNQQSEEWKTIPKAEFAATSARYAQQKSDAEGKLTQALLPVMMNQTWAQHVKDALQGLPAFPSGR